MNDYDPVADVWKSVLYAYEVIRERQRNGGPGWIPGMTVRILQGDCRDVLKTLPSDSVHCCVTSPPYWALRDYGCAGQIGLEATFIDFISEMVKVFREVRRVLRPDGTLWLNLGDSYCGGGGHSPNAPSSAYSKSGLYGEALKSGGIPVGNGLKPKDLCGIPWRVALALQDDGWWLRQDIIWAKPNPMPESVTDRCTKAHEYVFLLSKSSRYYFDAEAIKETSSENTHPRGPGNKRHKGTDAYAAGDDRHRTKAGLVAYSERKLAESGSGIKNNHSFDEAMSVMPSERNKRSVWEIATSPFPEAHFATFPPALVEPCIKAGTSEKGCCSKCGAPWVRQIEQKQFHGSYHAHSQDLSAGMSQTSPNKLNGQQYAKLPKPQTLGWSPTCTCQAPVVPCTVLDCFGGAGTTALVADRLQRNAVLIELNPEYAAMAERRIFGDAPLFASAVE